jgi:acyl-[acyl-carrier-protein] desaturase
MPGFDRDTAQLAIGEICNLRVHHDEVVLPVVRYLEALSMEGRSADAARAQQKSGRHLEKLDGQPGPLDEKLTARKARRRSGDWA